MQKVEAGRNRGRQIVVDGKVCEEVLKKRRIAAGSCASRTTGCSFFMKGKHVSCLNYSSVKRFPTLTPLYTFQTL